MQSSYHLNENFNPASPQLGATGFMKALPEDVPESSGLIFYNNRLITHNDSGNLPRLYEMDTLSSQVIRTIRIDNATNIDWEDITQDDNRELHANENDGQPHDDMANALVSPVDEVDDRCQRRPRVCATSRCASFPAGLYWLE